MHHWPELALQKEIKEHLRTIISTRTKSRVNLHPHSTTMDHIRRRDTGSSLLLKFPVETGATTSSWQP